MTKNIMIVGVGGQGTLLTSRILGGITLGAGYDVKLSEVHGMAQRGGSVVTFVRYGENVAEPIVEEQRIEPITVVTGAAEYPEHIVEDLEKEHTVYKIDAMEEAKKLGNSKVFNIIVLGMAAKHMDFSKEAWLKVIEETVPPKTVAINQKAFLKGFEG